MADITAEQARELLAKATPGPWYANIDDLVGGYCVGTVDGPASENSAASFVGDFTSARDAALIAAAPDLAATVIAQAARIEAARALHRAVSEPVWHGARCAWCFCCDVYWPCPTVAALDGVPPGTWETRLPWPLPEQEGK